MSQRLQGAAHSRAACSKDCAELILGQLCARRQAMLNHRIEDVLVDVSDPRANGARTLTCSDWGFAPIEANDGAYSCSLPSYCTTPTMS
jgi:hypothetical protein